MPETESKKLEPNFDFLDNPVDPHAGLKRIFAFEAWGVATLSLTIVYVLGLSGLGGPVGEFLIFITEPLTGTVGVWLIALALVIGTVHLFAAGHFPIAGRLAKLAFMSIPLLLAAWDSAMHLQIFYWDVEAREAAGWIGLLLGRGMRFMVGEMSLAVCLLFFAVMTFLILRLSPKAVFSSVWKGIKNFAVKQVKQRAKAEINPLAIQSDDQIVHEEHYESPIIAEFPVEQCAPEIESGEGPVHKKKKDVPIPDVPPGSQMDLALKEPPRKFKLPSPKLLAAPESPVMNDELRSVASQRILQTLETFGIPCEISNVITGPAVTRVEVVLGEGIRVKQVEGMEKDIAYKLPAEKVRIEAPIPGKTAVGIEFPNKYTNLVRLKELFNTDEWKKAKAPLTMAIAKDLNNKPVLADLGKMPHLLVAGQTGSGKSVCLHGIIMSLLYRLTPDQLRIILIDPKMVEFGFYEGLPHLLAPVVNEINDAVNTLRWAVTEMRDRYRTLKAAEARNIQAYNQQVAAEEHMPYIVIVIDEMADLMAQEGYEIEACITALTQLARAVGIHLILATQRPSVKIITGNIKANIPARIALTVASQIDSRTIIDHKGAENLVGNGDMLFNPIDAPAPIRCQGVFVHDDEIRRTVEFLRTQGRPNYDEEVTADHAPAKAGKESSTDQAEKSDEYNETLIKVLKVFLAEGEASASMLQTRIGMGYPRARRFVEDMEEMGLVGSKNGTKPRSLNFKECREMLAALEGNPAGSGTKEDDGFKFEDENNVDVILNIAD